MTSGFPDWSQSLGPGRSGFARSYSDYVENTSNANTEQTLKSITGKGVLNQITINIATNAVTSAVLRVYVDGESSPSFFIDGDSLISVLGVSSTVETPFWGIPYNAAGSFTMYIKLDIRFNVSLSIRVLPNTANQQNIYSLIQYLLFT